MTQETFPNMPKPLASYRIGPRIFEIWPQGDDKLAVKVRGREPFYWLKHPESRFETLSGAEHAILLALSK